MLKKIIASVILISMLLSFSVVCVAEGGVDISLSGNVSPGSEFEVSFIFRNDKKITGIEASFSYDPVMIEFISSEDGVSISGDGTGEIDLLTEASNEVRITAVFKALCVGDTEIAVRSSDVFGDDAMIIDSPSGIVAFGITEESDTSEEHGSSGLAGNTIVIDGKSYSLGYDSLIATRYKPGVAIYDGFSYISWKSPDGREFIVLNDGGSTLLFDVSSKEVKPLIRLESRMVYTPIETPEITNLLKSDFTFMDFGLKGYFVDRDVYLTCLENFSGSSGWYYVDVKQNTIQRAFIKADPDKDVIEHAVKQKETAEPEDRTWIFYAAIIAVFSVAIVTTIVYLGRSNSGKGKENENE